MIVDRLIYIEKGDTIKNHFYKKNKLRESLCCIRSKRISVIDFNYHKLDSFQVAVISFSPYYYYYKRARVLLTEKRYTHSILQFAVHVK